MEAIGADARSETAQEELEGQTRTLEELEQEVHRAGQRLERSRRALGVSPQALRGVVDIGLELSGAPRLSEGPRTAGGRESFELLEEPKAIEALYEVQMTRLTPVGLVIAWPEAMT